MFEIGREHEVDYVLWAGDAFEKRRPSPEELLAFERPLVEFDGRPAPVIGIVGNHCVSTGDGGTAMDVFAEAELLRLYRRPGIVPLGDVVVACLPWAPVSRIVAAQNGGDRSEINALAAEALLETARGMRNQADGQCVLLAHFAVSGASLPTGLGVEHMREPILPLLELQEIGYQAVILGHIHRAQTLSGAMSAPHFYVGSPMPLNWGEGNDRHGVWVLDTADWSTEFIEIESRAFVTLDAEAGDGEHGLLWPEVWAGHVEDAYVKLRYTATAEQQRRIGQGALREALLEAGAHRVWLEPQIVKASRTRVEGLTDDVDDETALGLYLDSIGIDAPARRETLLAKHREFAEAGA
jgi:DNA repair exonuclease SbcCD nuclease subunit